jgi:phenylpyruvate tautomerase PptA (4-oxalocrotonate tautomerase family)
VVYFFGAVDGVTDYMAATLADPTNWVGLLTGGISKAAALGVTQAGKQAVKLAAEEAGKRALAKGVTQAAALKAGDEAADAMD